MAETNRQWQSRQDGLDTVSQTSSPVPKPGDGEVLVRIKAVSLNFRDTEGQWSTCSPQRDIESSREEENPG